MRKLYSSLLLLIFIIACNEDIKYTYKIPEDIGDGWLISSLEEVQIDPLIITQLIAKVQSNYFENIDAILIVKDNNLVLDEYFNGFGREKKHKLWSCTKSFSSALVGIAIEHGYLESEKDRLVNYLGDYAQLRNKHIDSINIKHILEMSAGLKWEGDLSESGLQLAYSNDMVKYTLQLPKVAEPGVEFQYSSANSMLLAPIIFHATGMQADEFAKKTLFDALGIVNYEWNKQSEFWTKTVGKQAPAEKPVIKYDPDYAKLTNTATGLWMLPRDMAKLGQVYLNKGKWGDKQVIPGSWIEKSITEQIPGSDYGFHWKLMQIGKYKSFYASGFGLQRIFVVPKLNTVIVFTQNWYQDQASGSEQMIDILNQYILKAIEG